MITVQFILLLIAVLVAVIFVFILLDETVENVKYRKLLKLLVGLLVVVWVLTRLFL